MPKITCEVVNQKGMHARAAARIVALVCEFDCQVTLSHGEKAASGDSLIKLLTLNAPKGSLIQIEAEGNESLSCLDDLRQLFQSGFGE